MKSSFKARVAALEQAEQDARRFPHWTQELMRGYATPEEIAAWEAAGRPEIDRATFEAALSEAYGSA